MITLANMCDFGIKQDKADVQNIGFLRIEAISKNATVLGVSGI